jgi:hypothetical protein
MHLRARKLRGEQFDRRGIDLGAALPAGGDEVDVFGGVDCVQRRDAMVGGFANVEAGIDNASMQHAVALGALGMCDRLAAPEEAGRIVIRGSGRMVDAHRVSVRKITTLSTRGYAVESAGVMRPAPK